MFPFQLSAVHFSMTQTTRDGYMVRLLLIVNGVSLSALRYPVEFMCCIYRF